MEQIRRPPPQLPSHMHHSQSFDEIDSFLKRLLNIVIHCNLIVGWGEGIIKEGAVFCIKSIYLEEVLKS